MRFPFAAPFSYQTLDDWCTLMRPLDIEMTDNQYAHFAYLMRTLKRDFNGIPIRFVDAPTPV